MNIILLKILALCSFLRYGILSKENDLFTIRTKGCVIRPLRPLDDSIKHLVNTPHITCDPFEAPLLDYNDTHIWILKENINVFERNKFNCCYKHFKDEKSLEMADCINFKNNILINKHHEFIHVECFYMDNSIYNKFYAFVPLKTQRFPALTSNFNVLVLGLESMSRLNFYRTMPKTLKFFKDRGAIDMKGYNKLGDNSIPNLIPLLVGQSATKADKTCLKDGVWEDALEGCSIIWNSYQRAGYLTALGADSKAGLFESYFSFKNIPTDYYLHYFISQSTKIIGRNKRVNYHLCMGDEYYYNVLLNYIFKLTSKVVNNNLFGFFWEESVSHDDLNYPKVMDDNYATFFKNLENSGYLDKTIVILLSDHGFRWGEIVRTFQGHMEERLPLAYFLLPANFRIKYKRSYKNLKSNARKLTTPYDIYATLNDLINMPKELVRKKQCENNNKLEGISLFHQIPTNRTCASLGIESHWCTCYKGHEESVDDQTAKEAARQLLLHINKLLKAYQQCEKLMVEEVIRVSTLYNSDNDERTYNVIVKVAPGGGVFEGTLWRKGVQWAISGSVSRLDQYGHQNICIDDYYHKMYCYCK